MELDEILLRLLKRDGIVPEELEYLYDSGIKIETDENALIMTGYYRLARLDTQHEIKYVLKGEWKKTDDFARGQEILDDTKAVAYKNQKWTYDTMFRALEGKALQEITEPGDITITQILATLRTTDPEPAYERLKTVFEEKLSEEYRTIPEKECECGHCKECDEREARKCHCGHCQECDEREANNKGEKENVI